MERLIDMEFKIVSQNEPDCVRYLLIEDGKEKILLDEFSRRYRENSFLTLDERIKNHAIWYRGVSFNYHEMISEHNKFSDSLPFFQRYCQEVYPYEQFIMIGNLDYYRSAKFLKKTEECLQTARYYLISSKKYLVENSSIFWSNGYAAQYLIRSFNLTTSIIWYNSCFDYVLQIIFFAFELYKRISGYNSSWDIDRILKKCTYSTIESIYSKHKDINNFSLLWGILQECRGKLKDVNSWANYIKHRGGIEIIGLEAEAPYNTIVSDSAGHIMSKSNDQLTLEIDLDLTIVQLCETHKAIFTCLDELVSFINFNAAVPIENGQGKIVFQNKKEYMKISLP